MKQEFQSIAMLRKKFEGFKGSHLDGKILDCEGKASSTTNLVDFASKNKKKYEVCTTEKLIEVIKILRKENKKLRKINFQQTGEIKDLTQKITKIMAAKTENSSRPQSCLRASNSAPKKNRVVFSKELEHVLNETVPKRSKTMKSAKPKEEYMLSHNSTLRKHTKKVKYHESSSPKKFFEENEYYTPLSSSLQERKNTSQRILKKYDCSPKGKAKLSTKIVKF